MHDKVHSYMTRAIGALRFEEWFISRNLVHKEIKGKDKHRLTNIDTHTCHILLRLSVHFNGQFVFIPL